MSNASSAWAPRRFIRVGHGPVPFAHSFWLGIWRFDFSLTVWTR